MREDLRDVSLGLNEFAALKKRWLRQANVPADAERISVSAPIAEPDDETAFVILKACKELNRQIEGLLGPTDHFALSRIVTEKREDGSLATLRAEIVKMPTPR